MEETGKMQLIRRTSRLACSSALASGAGIALAARSRERAFLASALAFPAALNLQS